MCKTVAMFVVCVKVLLVHSKTKTKQNMIRVLSICLCLFVVVVLLIKDSVSGIAVVLFSSFSARTSVFQSAESFIVIAGSVLFDFLLEDNWS